MSVHNPYEAETTVVETPAEEEVAETTTEVVPEPTPEPALVVPEGSIPKVNAWVGTDKERAQLALDAELAGENRKSLIKTLTELVS